MEKLKINFSDEMIVNDASYFINNKNNRNNIIHFSYKNNNIYNYSSDFFHIRKKTGNSVIKFSKKFVIDNINHLNNKLIDEKVVCFISSFTRGTVHGYASIWEYLIYYLENNVSSKVLLSNITQQGMIDIVSKIIGKENIIFIERNIIYKIKEITFIPLNEFIFSDMFWMKVEPYLIKHIIDDNFKEIKKKICLVKSSIEDNCTSDGILNINDVKNFCNKNKIYNLEPSNQNEIITANLLWNCNIFITSWGSAYYKNIRYISEKCKKIYVIIPNQFINQFNERKDLPHSHTYKKYKNAFVNYIKLNNIKDLVIKDA
jgi:hypothetical protein